MDYQSNNLGVPAYANGFTLWHYITADVPTDVDTTGYFNPAADMMHLGDIIMDNTAASPAAGLPVARRNAAGVVDVADMTDTGAA